ncbi:nucleoside-diphosphate-sugar epimerase [Diaminobutyricimonas aerilata]|uniref:Nucleoside-diphosphate-sugar epimerase n=1 Tax=Diaminobutyricimonas aerilata TaxID=1162967 RepID=A0A2M9CNY8_9MICO|nr:NAD(P)-dependent oxidoreductase [Diaminobutyricimonas aerilata]PJJ73620.1 nucleoside-diphosphate-sugar epimerase [Diaminobutyricimonas aerilata]
MARILVAGASGVIGRRLLPALVLAGHEVHGTTRREERIERIQASGAHGMLLDALDGDAVHAAVREVHPDVVIHQLTDLAQLDFAGNARVRTDGTRHLVDAALAVGVERMVAQSIAWAYRPGATPADESTPLDLDDEGTGRRTYPSIAGLEAQVARMPVGVVLRYGLFYGPGTWYAPDGALAEQARQGRVTPTTDMTSWVHVDDAVAATVLAVEWPAGAVNVVDDDPAPAAEWAPIFCRGFGAELRELSPAPAPGRAASNALARSRGWAPEHPTWRESLLD